MKTLLLLSFIAADGGFMAGKCGVWELSSDGCTFVVGRAPSQQKHDQYGGAFEVKTTVRCGEIADYCGAKRRCDCGGATGTKPDGNGPKTVGRGVQSVRPTVDGGMPR